MKRLIVISSLISAFLLCCTKSGNNEDPDVHISLGDKPELQIIELNLRVHIMTDIIIPHPIGTDLY